MTCEEQCNNSSSNQKLNKTEPNPLTCSHLLSPVSLEFLDSVLMIYQDLLAGKSPNTVIVPTSIEQLPSVATEENDKEVQQQDGVESSTLAQCVDALCDRFKHW